MGFYDVVTKMGRIKEYERPLVDTLFGTSKLLQTMPFQPANNPTQHVWRDVANADGMDITPMDGEPPAMKTEVSLQSTPLTHFGGRLEIGADEILLRGGHEQVFAEEAEILVRKNALLLETGFVG